MPVAVYLTPATGSAYVWVAMYPVRSVRVCRVFWYLEREDTGDEGRAPLSVDNEERRGGGEGGEGGL